MQNLFLLIKETDVIQHIFYDGEETKKYYRNLDSLLKDIYLSYNSSFKGDRNFILLSDHGFHESGSYQFSIYSWLKANDYIKSKKSFEYRIS